MATHFFTGFPGFLGSELVPRVLARSPEEQTVCLIQKEFADLARTQLEIHADDVKCAHGSTIGHLSKDAMFFLRSRGIGEEDARLLLTKGFAHEVLERFPDAIRPLADGLLEQWFACRKTWEVA